MPAFSGLFSETGGHSLLDGRNPSRNALRRMMLKPGFRKTRELFDTLIGAAAGGTASASRVQIAHTTEGGKQVAETVSEINRATTATDVTALKEIVVNIDRSPAYPADASGNGGPALA